MTFHQFTRTKGHPAHRRKEPRMFKREPALWLGALTAILDAAILFGLHLTQAQEAGLVVAATAVLALVTRSQVTPAAGPGLGD